MANEISMPPKIFAVGWSLVPMFARALMVSSSASLNSFHHVAFHLPPKLPVISAPLRA